jgi:cyclopropane-fatty-acyl-phospholipid synthase
MIEALLGKFFRAGELVIAIPGGRSYRLGVAGQKPRVVIALRDRTTLYRLIFNPELAWGEAYMDGRLTIEEGSLHDLLTLLAINLRDSTESRLEKFGNFFRPLIQRLQQFNTALRARANVARHYDLPDQLFELFLDSNRQYSCAYFTDTAATLEAAQLAKMRHIMAKLRIESGMRVLDIGSGWGGLALYLARETGARVTGLTLSAEQHAYAEADAAKTGLSDTVKFFVRDYRDEAGDYDRVVSIGMFEHVGVGHYRAFFEKLKALLRPSGVALVHSIGRMDGPGTTNAWFRKYIFPGGYAPALSEVLPIVESTGLWLTDLEILRMHYARTATCWRDRFNARRAEAERLFGERFCRMWDFFLSSGDPEFRYLSTMVFQMQLSREIDAVPFTRDYIVDRERQAAQMSRRAKDRGSARLRS